MHRHPLKIHGLPTTWDTKHLKTPAPLYPPHHNHKKIFSFPTTPMAFAPKPRKNTWLADQRTRKCDKQTGPLFPLHRNHCRLDGHKTRKTIWGFLALPSNPCQNRWFADCMTTKHVKKTEGFIALTRKPKKTQQICFPIQSHGRRATSSRVSIQGQNHVKTT